MSCTHNVYAVEKKKVFDLHSIILIRVINMDSIIILQETYHTAAGSGRSTSY